MVCKAKPETRHLPTVGILLYRACCNPQPYIPQLIRHFEKAGLVPLHFINGVEGHVAVRDWMTTAWNPPSLPSPGSRSGCDRLYHRLSPSRCPLVQWRQGDRRESYKILTAKNVPYIVAAVADSGYSFLDTPRHWGCCSVVLALPELDGAIDPVPPAAVGEDIYLIPERVQRLIGRLKRWIALQQNTTRAANCDCAGWLGYGATGTAALLNVPRSLLKFLQALKDQGYTVGDLPRREN